jgi:hypothetical protein
MNISKIIKLPLYDCKVKLIITEDALDTVNKLHKKYKIERSDNDYIAGMMFSANMDLYVIVIDFKFLTYNTLQHEQFHAVMSITADRNIFEEEQRAWLSGYLAQEIYNWLNKKEFFKNAKNL